MYLVELRPGKEELYRTGDDLALAIRDGEVDARSRIFHRSTAKWISITLHPQYKAIVACKDDSLMAPVRKAWGLIPSALSRQTTEADVEERESSPSLERWKRPIGLGLAGLLLVMGIQLASTGPRPPWSEKSKPVAVATSGALEVERVDTPEPVDRIERGEGQQLVSLASTTTVWPVASELKLDTVVRVTPTSARRRTMPRAPRLQPRALRAALEASSLKAPKVRAASVEAILLRYAAASDSALVRLQAGMRVARLDRLFASSRLTPGGGVTHTRRSLAGAANFMRMYREQQAAVDAAYQDSVTVLAKRHHWKPRDVRQWYSRPPRKEDPALEMVSGSLIASIDSVLAVLDAQAGAYKLRGTAIAFEDPAAAQAYAALRRRIKEQIGSAVAAGGSTAAGPTAYLLQAIGTTSLPRET